MPNQFIELQLTIEMHLRTDRQLASGSGRSIFTPSIDAVPLFRSMPNAYLMAADRPTTSVA
jgi:hypothetical protein